MAHIKSHLLLASWVLAFTSLDVMPFWSPNAPALFPAVKTLKPETLPDPNTFVIECPPPPSFTAYELIKSTMTIIAATFWLVAFTLMAKDKDRVIAEIKK